MYRFGELMGIAFQIKDDLFDYEKTNIIGKPVGIDIKGQAVDQRAPNTIGPQQ